MSKRFSAPLIGCLLACIALTACGGGSSSSSTVPEASTTSAESGAEAAQGGGSSAVQKEAETVVQEHLAAPKSIEISTPVGKPIPQGKKIDVMTCGVGACTAWAEAFEEVGPVLGWEIDVIKQGTTSQEISAAWERVVSDPPDGVATIGISRLAFPRQAEALEKAGVPVFNASVAEEAGEGITGVFEGIKPGEEVGSLEASWVLAEEGTEANVLFTGSPEFPVTATFYAGFQKRFAEACPECELAEIKIAASAIGTEQPITQILGYLRSHPDVNYVVAGSAGFGDGLPAALQTAGLSDKVGIISTAGGPTQFVAIKEGSAWKAEVPSPLLETAWTQADALARTFVGASIKPDERVGRRMILNAENITETGEYFPLVANYRQEFEKLWGVN